MATVLENLVTTRERIAQQLADMVESPKPDYGIGGQSVSWGAHFNNLRAIANTNEEAWRRTQLHSDVEVARLRAALAQNVRDCTARKAVMIARKALEA